MRRRALASVFGKDMLDDSTQVGGFEELLAIDRQKPFECVGEVNEARALLRALADSTEWRDAAVVRALAPKLSQPGSGLEPFLSGAPEHNVPSRFIEDLQNVA
jgi:UDP-N-acetyl-alpha-D-muramoyl-L-alanyl-L-glutamate epimerase